MNGEAVKIEEAISNLTSYAETILYNGWVLKIVTDYMMVYPIYSKSKDNMLERIQLCERIGKRKGVTCIFRIVQYTNYYLKSRLSDYGYKDCHRAIICSFNLSDDCTNKLKENDAPICKASVEINNIYRVTGRDYISTDISYGECVCIIDEKQIKKIGIKQENLLFINDGLMLNKSELISIIQFAKDKEISIISVNIPEHENLPAIYEQLGFERKYTYTCYQKEGFKNGFTK